MFSKSITISLVQLYVAQAMNLSMDQCQDTNVDASGALIFNSINWDCGWYDGYNCWQYRTDLFDADAMCCICGGGADPNEDDGDEAMNFSMDQCQDTNVDENGDELLNFIS